MESSGNDIVVGCSEGTTKTTVAYLPHETLRIILEYVYPYVLDAKHAFFLVCKQWKASFDDFQSRGGNIYTLRWPKDNFDVKFDFSKLLLQHILRFEGGGYLSCDIIWKAERLCTDICSMKGSDEWGRSLYNHGIDLMEEVAEEIGEELIAAKEKGILLAKFMRELSTKLAVKLSVITYVLGYLERRRNLSLKTKAIEIFDSTFSTYVDAGDRPQYGAVLTEAQNAGNTSGVGIENFIYEDCSTRDRSLIVQNDDAIVLKSGVLHELVNLSKLYGTTSQNLVLTSYGQHEMTFEIFERARAFCAHDCIDPMLDIPKPLPSSDLSDVVQPWYASFACNMSQDQQFDLLVFANSFDIEHLMLLHCAGIAAMMKGKTPEEIRQTFNIQNYFTPEEEEQIRRENAWCEEE